MTTSRFEALAPVQAGGSKQVRWRRPLKWVLLGVLVVLALFVAVRLIAARSFANGPQPAEMSKLRSIPATLPDGRKGNLGSLITPGIPTVISIWASWCGPCRKEAPVLASLRRRFGADKMNLLYLNGRETGATRAELQSFVRGVGLPDTAFAVLDDTSLLKLTNDPTNLIPRTYVFDRQGNFTAMIVGYKPRALARIEGLIAR